MFGEKIISWYLTNKRDLPWRNTHNPYFIWLSEIILQQTRVSQGLPYYEKFVEKYPTIEDLANAEEEEVLRLWQGLGYYSRGRNLHKTSIFIQNELNGKFPESFKELQKLKGVGKYTAAAIASFAYNETVPAIDGNALRVISRYFEIFEPIDNIKTQNRIFDTSLGLIPKNQAGLYNQAVMELGATICLPKKTQCNNCPVRLECLAFTNKTVEQIPIKEKKIKVTERTLDYIIIEFEDRYWLKKRGEKDIWANMYDFFLDEGNIQNFLEKHQIKDFKLKTHQPFQHLLTHQKLIVNFTMIQCSEQPTIEGGEFYELETIKNLPKPKIIADFFEKTI
ncbi:A/G-specific adenine glycosylase [Lacihabitans sp. LS3-19]|uniref:A/G-specific adenine glycosylase n=1 Tax=Lacihabitans sp. LS3-19 TaxID=2487335 RepID=UPI0020CC619C|nr:A/G-specific adenine glycosylase [Lacihabitans sp. LS3-19]MCP9768295.1 A/G-specific adenine glycosylase [Lacihabitans sp. LS3-19]